MTAKELRRALIAAAKQMKDPAVTRWVKQLTETTTKKKTTRKK